MKKYLLFILLLSLIYPRWNCLQEAEIDASGRSTRPDKDTFSISPSGHFYIHYDFSGFAAPDPQDLDGNNVPDYVDQVGIIADSARHVLIDVDMLGYASEPSDGSLGGGDGKYDIYIMSYGAGSYGFCVSEGAGKSYLKIDNDYVGHNSNFGQTPIEIMQISLVHEYFHAIQFGYSTSLHGNTYFYEMTSMWFEDIMIPDGNDYLDGWADPLLNNPTADFDTGNGYELALFGHYLSSFLDPKGVDNVLNSTIIREMWERYSNTDDNALSAVNYVLDGEKYNYTFIEAWTDFISRNIYNGLDENFYYYSDQALIEPIATSIVLLSTKTSFNMELDNKSAAIKSFRTIGLIHIIDIIHSQNNFIGKLAIVSSDTDKNEIISNPVNLSDELYADIGIHFIYGSNASSQSLAVEIIVSPRSNEIISIYPNPISRVKELTIDYALNGNELNTSLELIDIRGRVVNLVKLNSLEKGWHTEDIGNLMHGIPASGIYFIRLRPENGVANAKKITILP